jgi:pimeloyl-ACP methyl ester carboxylesterase
VSTHPRPTVAFASPDRQAEFFAAYDAVLTRWPVPVTGVDVDSPYGTTHVLVCGPEDGEPMVLLPGYGATATAWFAAAGALARDHRVYAVDPLGQAGRSVPHGEPIRAATDLTAWLGHLLTALGLERVHLCGHSFGAWTAMTYALNHALEGGHRLRSLSLLDPTRCFAGFRPSYLLHAAPMLLRPTDGRVRGFLHWETGGRALDPAWLTLHALGSVHFPAAKVVPNRPPRPARLASSTVPTLVLLAERSRAHDIRAVAANARARLPRVVVDVLPGAMHHSIPTEQAPELTRRLTAFLEGIDDE